jgi:eukaryotic-like serine/threonine-protein kinase
MDHHDPAARALTLFDRYAEMPHAELSRALTELRQQDNAVCAQLMRLLAADEQTHSFASPLQWFVAQGGSAQNDSMSTAQSIDRIWPDGTRLGPWCVDGIIGLGGMGVIYAAHRADGLYEREVALKTIRAEIMSPSLQQAFAKERSHLAKLEHPSIVALYDAGVVEDGLPWLAMARVHGDSIDRWCDTHKKSLSDRVRLLIEACDAIGFAHAHGVLHQDIKPSNLLVTDDGNVKLLDFGLSAMLTQHGDSGFTRVGVSAAYAAPEVFEGAPPSVAIDVYALGVVLYRLLCEDWPRIPCALTALPNASDDEARSPSALASKSPRETAQSRDARDAHALSRALQGDLDAIALRCVHADPVERYASATDLRADLQAWLANRPVMARDGGWVYRSSRFVRRNALAVAATAVLVSATTGGGVVALQQQQRAELEAENGEILGELFESSLGAATLNSLGSAPLSSKTLLEETERRLRAAAGDDRPQLLARGLAALARSYLVRVDYKNAERLLTESKALGIGNPLQMARTDAALAQMLNQRGKPADAERLVKEGLAMIPQRDGIGDELARLDLEVQQAQSRLKQGDPKAAFAILDDGVESAKALGKDAWPTLAVLLRLRSQVNKSMGRFDDEGKDLRSALAASDERKLGIRNGVRQALAMHLARKGEKEESHRLAADALVSSMKVFGPSHAETGTAWLTIAKTWYVCKSDQRRTLIALKLSEAILAREFGPIHPQLEDVIGMRVELTRRNEDWEEGLRYARQGVEIAERFHGPHFERTLIRKNDLAIALIGVANIKAEKEKAPYYREADSILTGIIREGERRGLDMSSEHADRVVPLLYLKRIDEADREAQIGLDNAASQGEQGVGMGHAKLRMANVRIAQRRFDEASALIASRLKYLPPIEKSPFDHYNMQGMLLYVEIERGDTERIRAQYEKVREVADRYGFMDQLNAEEIPGINAQKMN